MPGEPDQASSARTYDYLAGGCDWHLPDRELGEELERLCPGTRRAAADNREFLSRAVRWAAQQGIGQYLDAGCGMLRPGRRLGEAAREILPAARVAYIDRDEVAAGHAEAVTAATPGAVAVRADLRCPAKVLGNSRVAKVIDPAQRVAVIFGGVLHYQDPAASAQVVAGWAARVAAGSLIVVTVPVYDDPAMAAKVRDAYTPASLHCYTPAGVEALFKGLEIMPPGVGWAGGMRPGWADAACAPAGIAVYAAGGIGRVR